MRNGDKDDAISIHTKWCNISGYINFITYIVVNVKVLYVRVRVCVHVYVWL